MQNNYKALALASALPTRLGPGWPGKAESGQDMLITDIRPGEPDLIAGYELSCFEVRTLDDGVLDSNPTWMTIRFRS